MLGHSALRATPAFQADPSTTWLVPLAGAPLHFTVKGVAAAAATFKPPWAIQPHENFTAFPVRRVGSASAARHASRFAHFARASCFFGGLRAIS